MESDAGPFRLPSSSPAASHLRSSAASYLEIRPSSTWTNATFAEALCSGITPSTSNVYVDSAASKSNWFLLPDCFYFASSRVITHIILEHVIIQGNSTFPDPLQRLALAISTSPSYFGLSDSILLSDTGANATINWNAISSIISSVSTLSFSNVNLGIGATIPTFAKPIPTLSFTSCGLSGTLPARLFASSAVVRAFRFSVSGNKLRGSIPPSLFAGLNVTAFTTVSINMENCGLVGTIPPTLLSGRFSSLREIHVYLADNQLTGPLTNLYTSVTFDSTVLSAFYLQANHNKFTGPLPNWLSSISAQVSSYTFYCEKCGLSGPLPSHFFGDARIEGALVTIYACGNQLSGVVPSTFFSMKSSPRELLFELGYNRLASLPSDVFDSTNFTSSHLVIFDFHSNQITGDLPASAGHFGDLTFLEGYLITLYNNSKLSGSVPPTFMNSIVKPSKLQSRVNAHVNINIAQTKVTGTLALPDFSGAPNLQLVVLAPDTRLSSLSFPFNATSALTSLVVDSNKKLTGTLPSSLFQLNPLLKRFSAHTTNLNGTMPDMGVLNPQDLEMLYLYNTRIDFCSRPRSPWSSNKLASCLVFGTNANDCLDYYPNVCTRDSFPPTKPPKSLPSTPTFIPGATPSGCSPATRPSTHFVCISAIWTFTGDLVNTRITIPAGAKSTLIEGNLRSSTVTFSSLDSVLTVAECVYNSTFAVEISDSEATEIGPDGIRLTALITLRKGNDCNAGDSGIVFKAIMKEKSCKKLSTTYSVSGGLISGLILVDATSCNLRWSWSLIGAVAGILVLLLGSIARFTREALCPSSKLIQPVDI